MAYIYIKSTVQILMPYKSGKPDSFWQELKRRKVIRVTTVYAATAFIILQFVDIIAQPLQLPSWTLTFVIVLLGIGLVITGILSWVYDITPNGVKKTRSSGKLKFVNQTNRNTQTGWKIATYVSAIIIVTLVAFNLINKINLNADISKLEKSIAVLPFINDSQDTINAYFINGIMEKITTNLQMVKEFRVISRTSVEQFRNSKKSVSEIARELDVNYIVEGSGQKYGNSFSVVVQFIKASRKESHLWAKPYEQELKKVEDYINIQSQIALDIASELKAIISPDEKKLIEKVPTTNLTAYELFLKANDYLSGNQASLRKAATFYNASLEIDSTFARAYLGLAQVYWYSNYWETYFKENFLDSCLVLINKALFYDDQLYEAYLIKGMYYKQIGETEKALENYDKALVINRNCDEAYFSKGDIYSNIYYDYVKGLDNYHKGLNLRSRDQRLAFYNFLGSTYLDIGFIEKARFYFNEVLKSTGDSLTYFIMLASIESELGNYEEAIKLEKKMIKIDPDYFPDINSLSIAGHDEEAYQLAKRSAEARKGSNIPNLQYSHRIGYAFWKAGKKKEARDYFNQQIKYDEETIRLNRDIAQSKYAQYDLAATYAFLGYTENAYKYLDDFNALNFYPLWWVTLAKNDPLFEGIRSEERFKKILNNMETRHDAEHERVKKWLEENNML